MKLIGLFAGCAAGAWAVAWGVLCDRRRNRTRARPMRGHRMHKQTRGRNIVGTPGIRRSNRWVGPWCGAGREGDRGQYKGRRGGLAREKPEGGPSLIRSFAALLLECR